MRRKRASSVTLFAFLPEIPVNLNADTHTQFLKSQRPSIFCNIKLTAWSTFCEFVPHGVDRVQVAQQSLELTKVLQSQLKFSKVKQQNIATIPTHYMKYFSWLVFASSTACTVAARISTSSSPPCGSSSLFKIRCFSSWLYRKNPESEAVVCFDRWNLSEL